jgi:hypothetical protein
VMKGPSLGQLFSAFALSSFRWPQGSGRSFGDQDQRQISGRINAGPGVADKDG